MAASLSAARTRWRRAPPRSRRVLPPDDLMRDSRRPIRREPIARTVGRSPFGSAAKDRANGIGAFVCCQPGAPRSADSRQQQARGLRASRPRRLFRSPEAGSGRSCPIVHAMTDLEAQCSAAARGRGTRQGRGRQPVRTGLPDPLIADGAARPRQIAADPWRHRRVHGAVAAVLDLPIRLCAVAGAEGQRRPSGALHSGSEPGGRAQR